MSTRAVIFDFNGTLFWDTEYQETSWDQYLEKHGISLTDDQKREYIHGRNGRDTFEVLFQKKLSDAEVHDMTEEKEILYRKECLKHKMELAPGVDALLKYLKENNVLMAIATAAGKSNVDFFIEHFGLLDYFEMEHIIYNDGTVRGKPHPDLFNKAIKALGCDKSETVIFEDSSSGIQAAINSGVAKVVIVNSNGYHFHEFQLPVITHFDQFDRSEFKQKV